MFSLHVDKGGGFIGLQVSGVAEVPLTFQPEILTSGDVSGDTEGHELRNSELPSCNGTHRDCFGVI